MGSKARRQRQAKAARDRDKAARERRAGPRPPTAAEALKLAALTAEAEAEVEQKWAHFRALEAAALAHERPPSKPARGRGRRFLARYQAAERVVLRAEQAALQPAGPPPALARATRRLVSFGRIIRIEVGFWLIVRRMRRQGRRLEVLGRRAQDLVRAARVAVKKAKLSPGRATTAPQDAIAAAGRLLDEARHEQGALLEHCRHARNEMARWEDVARHELTSGREKHAKRALARRNQWARAFRRQVLEAEKQQAALAAHDGLLQALRDELERHHATAPAGD
jgi:hypothetical protein